MRRYFAVVSDERAVGIWLWLAIIAIIAIVIGAAWLVLAGDSPDINAPSSEDEHRLAIKYEFTATNMPAGIFWMKENERVFKVTVEDFDYEAFTWGPGQVKGLEELGLFNFGKDNHFEFKLVLLITGPNGFEEKETFKIEMDIGEGDKRDVDFGTRYCYIAESGTYRVKATLEVHAPAEDIIGTDDLKHNVIWIHEKAVEIS